MAELNVFANNLEKELTCPICEEIFTNPRTLKCLHSFCLQCISNWNASCRCERQPLTCPTCRSVVRLEGNDVSSLPSSFHLEPQLQLLRDMKIAADSKSQQGLPATIFSDFKEENVNSYTKIQIPYCQKRFHEKNKLDFYCTTCKQCICVACTGTEHKPHHTVTVEEAAEEVKVLIMRDMNRVNEVKEKYEEELELSRQNMTRIEQETNAAIHQVSDEVENHIKVLLKHERTVIETLKGKLLQQKTQNDEEQREIRDGIESISEFNLRGQTLLDENVAHFIVKSQQERSQRCATFLEKPSILANQPTGHNASLRYKPNPQVTQSLQDIGTVVVTKNGQDMKNSPVQTVMSRGFRGEAVKTFGEKGNGRGQLTHPRSLAVSNRGEVAIADMGNHRIVIFSVDGEYLRHFGEKGTGDGQLTNPFGVVFNGDRLLVTDGNDRAGRLQEVDVNGTYCRTIFKKRGLKLLGMCSTNESIAVCFEALKSQHKSGIKVFNKQSGQLIQEIPCDKNDEVPWYIAYGNGKYFVSYTYEDCIRVFNNNGRFLYTLGSEKGMGDGQFSRTRGLAVVSDVIIVCDRDNHRVQMLSQDGRFISSFGSRGSGLGEMYWPMDIAVSPDGRVFVVDNGNHRVHAWR